MKLTQKELVQLVSILKQLQLVYKDSKDMNLTIEKLESYIVMSKPEDIVKVKTEGVK